MWQNVAFIYFTKKTKRKNRPRKKNYLTCNLIVQQCTVQWNEIFFTKQKKNNSSYDCDYYFHLYIPLSCKFDCMLK